MSLCRQAIYSRPDSRFLSKCAYLPESDRTFFTRVRQVAIHEDNENDTDDDHNVNVVSTNQPQKSSTAITHRFKIRRAPYLDVYVHHPCVTLDSGAELEANIIKSSVAQDLGAKIKDSTTLWPGDFVELKLPDSVQTGEPLTLEPCTEAPVAISLSACGLPRNNI